jgi:hypothetical protein
MLYPADFIIDRDEWSNPRVVRWWVMRGGIWRKGKHPTYDELRKSTSFNIYLHRILVSDAPPYHDHPWPSLSIMLEGSMSEHVMGKGKRHVETRQIVYRPSGLAHWLELAQDEQALTLFLMGPRVRQWGFWCPKGWRPAYEFREKGCGEK